MRIIIRSKTALVVALMLSFFVQVVEASEWHDELPHGTHQINIDDGSNYTANMDSPDNHCCQLHCHHVFIQDIVMSPDYQKNSQLPATADTAYRYVRLSSLLRPPALI